VLADLTEREREALALMAEGRTNQAIAATLYLSLDPGSARARSSER